MTSLTHCSVLAMTLVALPALASGDGDGCGFWLTDCPLPTYPLYLNENDTRGNLLMLLGDAQHHPLPFTLPADPLNERSQPLFYLTRLPQPEEVEDPALREQLELTTRKLENLTDIERQLSSRKPGGNFGSEKVPEVIHDDP